MISSSMASIPSPAGCPLKPTDRCLGSVGLANLSFRSNQPGGSLLPSAKRLTVHAERLATERRSSSSLFVSGFVLGGVIVGALGCVYAPQGNAGIDKKDLMRKLLKFIYDEDKALETKRKKLTEKIAQLNVAIDGVSSQFRLDDVADDDIPQTK